MNYKKLIDKATNFLRDSGKVDLITKLDEYQNKINSYLEADELSKVLALLLKLKQEYNITGGDDIISYFQIIASAPLVESEIDDLDYPYEKVEALMYKFTGDSVKQIIQIEDGYSFGTCKHISDLIANKILLDKDFENKKVMPFIVSNNKEANGRIIQQLSLLAPYTLMAVKLKKHGDANTAHLTFLDSQKELGAYGNEEFVSNFYTYIFVSEENNDQKEYILLSKNKLPILEDVRIKGMLIPISDKIKIGTQAAINKGAELIFVTGYKKIIRNITHNEFLEIAKKYKNNYEKLYSDFFGKFRHPKIFENFMLSWLFASSQAYGPMNVYKPNLILLGPTRGGKSRLLDCMATVFNETKAGENTTIKAFVPNFGGNRPDAGLFIKKKRLLLSEEFFTKLNNKDGSILDVLKSLLVHDNVSASSGKFDGQSIIGKATATMVIASNFLRPRINNLTQLASHVDPSFLSRFIIYVQSKEHYNFVEEQKSKVDMDADYLPKYNISKIEMYDYFLNKKVNLNGYSIKDIFDYGKDFIPDDSALREAYNGANEHIIRLLDGVVKKNYLLNGLIGEFKVTEQDFNETKEIWSYVINSWTGDVTKLKLNQKIQMLTHKQKIVYEYIKMNNGACKEKIETDLNMLCSNELKVLSNYELIKLSKLSDKCYEIIDENKEILGNIEVL